MFKAGSLLPSGLFRGWPFTCICASGFTTSTCVSPFLKTPTWASLSAGVLALDPYNPLLQPELPFILRVGQAFPASALLLPGQGGWRKGECLLILQFFPPPSPLLLHPAPVRAHTSHRFPGSQQWWQRLLNRQKERTSCQAYHSHLSGSQQISLPGYGKEVVSKTPTFPDSEAPKVIPDQV